MKIIDDYGVEYELIEMNDSTFSITQKKAEPAWTLTPYKVKWDDPTLDTVDRYYKGIKVGDKFYAYKPIK